MKSRLLIALYQTKQSSTGCYIKLFASNVPHNPQKMDKCGVVLNHRLYTTHLWLNYRPFSKCIALTISKNRLTFN